LWHFVGLDSHNPVFGAQVPESDIRAVQGQTVDFLPRPAVLFPEAAVNLCPGDAGLDGAGGVAPTAIGAAEFGRMSFSSDTAMAVVSCAMFGGVSLPIQSSAACTPS